MFDLEILGEGEPIDADWLERLVRSVLAARIASGDGADILPIIDEGGTSLRLSNLARYQAKPAIVVSMAPAATVPEGTIRRCYWGTMQLLNAVAIDADADPPTIDFDVDLDNNVAVPFFNPYTSAASAGAGSLIWVAPTPWGWALLADECD